jgi:hypothetical protein
MINNKLQTGFERARQANLQVVDIYTPWPMRDVKDNATYRKSSMVFSHFLKHAASETCAKKNMNDLCFAWVLSPLFSVLSYSSF